MSEPNEPDEISLAGPEDEPGGPEGAATRSSSSERLERSRRPGSGGTRSGGTGRPIVRTVQPWRAAVIVVVAVAVGTVVLARGGAGPRLGTVLALKPSTTNHVPATTVARTTVPTTVPTTTTTTLAPSSVKVLVLNGWTTPHGALFFQKRLETAGYDTLAPNDATSASLKTSQVLFSAARYQPNALAIAASLAVPASEVTAEAPADESAVPATLLTQAQVIVVIGQDISNQVPAGYTG